MKNQEVLLCPHCGGVKIKSTDAAKAPLILTVFFASTIIGIPIAISTLVAWFIIKNNTSKRFSGRCLDCKQTWRLTEEKFYEHKQAIYMNEKLQV